MKKIILLSLAFLMVGISYGQNHKGKGQQTPIKDVQVINFLNKTNMIIKASHEQVKINEVYTGGVYTAKEFQQKAIDEFKLGQNQKAINTSYTARRLAFRAYNSNSSEEGISGGWKLNEIEKTLVKIKVTPEMINNILSDEKAKHEQEEGFDVDDLDDLEETSKGKTQN
jgi:hypothetical protein